MVILRYAVLSLVHLAHDVQTTDGQSPTQQIPHLLWRSTELTTDEQRQKWQVRFGRRDQCLLLSLDRYKSTIDPYMFLQNQLT